MTRDDEKLVTAFEMLARARVRRVWLRADVYDRVTRISDWGGPTKDGYVMAVCGVQVQRREERPRT